MKDKSQMAEHPPINESTSLFVSAKNAVKERDYGQAEALLSQLLALEPKHLNALDLMGFVLFFQGRYAECESYCLRALEIAPRHVYALNGLGMALSRQGHLERGVEVMTQAIEINPTWPEPYWDMAVVLIEAGEAARAIEVLARGIANIPASRARFERLLNRIKDSQ